MTGKIHSENLSKLILSSDNEKGYLSSWLVPRPSVEGVEAGPGRPLHQPMVAGSAHTVSWVERRLWREGRELACDRDIATHPQEHQVITTTDDKADFIILLVSMTVP